MRNPGMRASASFFLFFAFVISHSSFVIASDPPAATLPQAMRAGWPQLMNNPQRTGYSEEVITPSSREYLDAFNVPGVTLRPMQVGWQANFLKFDPPEHIHRTVQVIAYDGRLFVPTMEGSLFALNPDDGKTLWRFHCGEGIMHTAGAENGRVFFATMRGSVYALDAWDGTQLWRWNNGMRTGFSSAVLLVEDKVFVGGRGGVFYAINQADGSEAWSFDVGAPIYQSAAYNDGRVYVAAEDMHCYAWSAADGKLAWKSEKLQGMSFRDYWPLVYNGVVIVESQAHWDQRAFDEAFFPFTFRNEKLEKWFKPFEESFKAGIVPEPALADMLEAQEKQLEALEKEPFKMLRFALDEKTGAVSALPYWQVNMAGAQPPPVVDRDGMLCMNVSFWCMYSWARMDPASWRVVDILWDGAGGMGNSDENHVLSAAGPYIFAVHWYENSNCGRAEYFDLGTRKWTMLPHGLAGAVGYQEAQLGTNPASIAYNAVYHQAFSLVHNWVPTHVKFGKK